MKCPPLSRLVAAPAVAALASLAGCNGAQFNTPPPQDAGPPCSSIAPIVSCDAGGPPAAGQCTAEPTSPDPVVRQIPPGNYPPQCTVQFYFDDLGSGCTPAANPCTCVASSPSEDGGAPTAQWSSCADAGLNGS